MKVILLGVEVVEEFQVEKMEVILLGVEVVEEFQVV